MKTHELSGAALDWAVSLIINPEWEYEWRLTNILGMWTTIVYEPSTNWAQAGPIIERERLSLYDLGGDEWGCDDNLTPRSTGLTPLVAAMRCFVTSKLGDKVEIPKALTE